MTKETTIPVETDLSAEKQLKLGRLAEYKVVVPGQPYLFINTISASLKSKILSNEQTFMVIPPLIAPAKAQTFGYKGEPLQLYAEPTQGRATTEKIHGEELGGVTYDELTTKGCGVTGQMQYGQIAGLRGYQTTLLREVTGLVDLKEIIREHVETTRASNCDILTPKFVGYAKLTRVIYGEELASIEDLYGLDDGLPQGFVPGQGYVLWQNKYRPQDMFGTQAPTAVSPVTDLMGTNGHQLFTEIPENAAFNTRVYERLYNQFKHSSPAYILSSLESFNRRHNTSCNQHEFFRIYQEQMVRNLRQMIIHSKVHGSLSIQNSSLEAEIGDWGDTRFVPKQHKPIAHLEDIQGLYEAQLLVSLACNLPYILTIEDFYAQAAQNSRDQAAKTLSDLITRTYRTDQSATNAIESLNRYQSFVTTLLSQYRS